MKPKPYADKKLLPLAKLLTVRRKPGKGNGPRDSREVACLILFRRWVCENKKMVKALEEADWFDMSLGFFIGRECSYADAHRLALYARYDMHYWTAVEKIMPSARAGGA